SRLQPRRCARSTCRCHGKWSCRYDRATPPQRDKHCHTQRSCPVFADARPTSERHEMKIVVIGGTGLIGSKLVTQLNERGHEAIPASPDTGVNTITGAGLK